MATAHTLTLTAESAEWTLPSRRKIGVISLIVTETALFTIFAVAYLFYIGKSLTGPYPAQVLEPPILATICLLSSSITIMLAERAFRNEAHGSFKFWWLITIVLAVVFLGWTALEWRRLIYQHNLTIATNLFGTSFYSLVGGRFDFTYFGFLAEPSWCRDSKLFRAHRDDLLVLAFRRCRVGSRFHSRIHNRSLRKLCRLNHKNE